MLGIRSEPIIDYLLQSDMDKSQQELLQSARRKLERGQYTVEQREQILRTLDLLLELARSDEKIEDNARATAKLLANVTNHRNLVAIIQQQAAELDALKRISVNLTSSLQMQTILDAIVNEAMHLIKDARDAHIFLYQDGKLRFGASLDSEGKRNLIYSVPRSEGMTYTVAQTRQVVMAENLRKHPLFANVPADWGGAIIGIPLMINEGVVGVMNMARWSTGGFNPSELRLLGLLADQAALAINNARLHQAMANQAMSDSLTGLPNRRALDARLENDVQRAVRYKHKFAVLMIDLDGFKAINDTYGHGVGDEVLHQFAQFLAESQRSSDFLARYGGDELVMILPETDIEAAKLVADHLRERMSRFEISLPDGSKRNLSITGGIAIYPTHAQSASDLLRAADEALYRAKRKARGIFMIALDRIGGITTPR
jgi:diguanylate cyclase (GGDEF)-like protein